jgi:hypothetical protein
MRTVLDSKHCDRQTLRPGIVQRVQAAHEPCAQLHRSSFGSLDVAKLVDIAKSRNYILSNFRYMVGRDVW